MSNMLVMHHTCAASGDHTSHSSHALLFEHLFKEKEWKHVGIKEKYIPNNQEIELAYSESFSSLKIEVEGSN